MISIGRFVSFASGLSLSLGLLGGMPGAARAQNPPPAAPAAPVCDIDENSPGEVVRAFLTLQSAIQADTAGGVKLRHVRTVMQNATTNLERGLNVPGRNYIMAKALFVLSGIKGFPVQTTRGQLGLTTSPDLPVDVHIAMDSLLTRVEESNPSCAAEIQAYYRLSTVWLDIMQQATALLDEDKPDSAEKLVVRAQILERKSPYTWQLLATIASKRNQLDKALEYWQKTYEAAGSDTTLTEVRMQALYFMGEVNLGLATTKQGAEAVALAREAAKWFRQHLAEDSRNKDSPAARANLATALMAAGDTAQLPTIYADLIANPTQYTAADHLQAGVSATTAGKTEDAVKLFRNALATSPFDRDALFNLCVSMFQSKMYQEMIEPARQLVEVDPNNPDNHELLVYAYAMIESTETDPVRKKSLSDSLSKYNPEYERVKASHKVAYSIFHRGENLAALTGSVQNLGTAERSFSLVFDFVDKDRNVIGQGETTVGPVKPNEAVPFEVKLERSGVVAFKARPIPPT